MCNAHHVPVACRWAGPFASGWCERHAMCVTCQRGCSAPSARDPLMHSTLHLDVIWALATLRMRGGRGAQALVRKWHVLQHFSSFSTCEAVMQASLKTTREPMRPFVCCVQTLSCTCTNAPCSLLPCFCRDPRLAINQLWGTCLDTTCGLLSTTHCPPKAPTWLSTMRVLQGICPNRRPGRRCHLLPVSPNLTAPCASHPMASAF